MLDGEELRDSVKFIIENNTINFSPSAVDLGLHQIKVTLTNDLDNSKVSAYTFSITVYEVPVEIINEGALLLLKLGLFR